MVRGTLLMMRASAAIPTDESGAPECLGRSNEKIDLGHCPPHRFYFRARGLKGLPHGCLRGPPQLRTKRQLGAAPSVPRRVPLLWLGAAVRNLGPEVTAGRKRSQTVAGFGV